MEIREHPVRNFMPKYERFEPLILDSTAITTFKECNRKYFFQIVIAKNSKDTPIYFTFGSAYHKFREVLETTKDFKVALLAGLEAYDKGTGGREPSVEDKFSFMTKMRLIQSCKAAYDHWEKEKQQGRIEVIAIEQPFNVEIHPDSGEYTSGRFDQIVRWNGKVWGRDFKTTSKEGIFYQRGLDPNDQFTRYTFAESELCGEQVFGQIVEALYNSKKQGPSITQYVSSRTLWQIDDWKADELQIRRQLQLSREHDVWPKNEKACTFCPFHSVCKMGSMASQQAKLDAEFVTRPWDNTKIGVTE